MVRSLADPTFELRFYSPVSRPEDYGHIDIMIRTDWKGGPIVDFLTKLQPGGLPPAHSAQELVR